MFRASSVADLMTGMRGLTAGQEAMLAEIRMREAGEFMDKSGKPLGVTGTQKEALPDLLLKEKGEGFEMTQTAKRRVEAEWLRNKFGYKDVVLTKPMLKGMMCEQDSFGLLQAVLGGEFRVKNRERFVKGLLRGEPDDLLAKENVVEDVKTSWDLRTFFEVRDFDLSYYGQGQAYLYLTDREKFRLAYCLVDTPEELLMDMERSYFFKFGCNEDNPHYQDIIEQLRLNHVVSDRIPEEERVKVFEIERDEEYIEEMLWRIDNAMEYYETLKLNDVNLSRKVTRVNIGS